MSGDGTLVSFLRRAGSCLAFLCLAALLGPVAAAHDIPNQRVDRSTQATLRPGTLRIDYEVSLTELTLTQDLRRLIGSLPGADRSEWLARYGQETGPLNARGFLIHCDGRPVELRVKGFDLAVEEHPRYTFHLEAPLPDRGRLVIHDTNYISSEGTSRLAVRGRDGVVIEGDDLAAEVSEIPIRPVWQLSDEEERRTRLVALDFRGPANPEGGPTRPPAPAAATEQPPPPSTVPPAPTEGPPASRLAQLLDRRPSLSWLGVMLIAAALGAAHSIQPGHGKTLVTAAALGPGGRWYHPVILGLAVTLAHTGSVLLVAAGLWYSGTSQVVDLHQVISRIAGFAIAAGGVWRIGGALRGGDAESSMDRRVVSIGSLWGLIGLGLAGGAVPCWDAVALVVLSAALNRLATGVWLVLAFGLGMAAVLVTVGLVASRLRTTLFSGPGNRRLESGLALLSGLLLACVGLAFFLS